MTNIPAWKAQLVAALQSDPTYSTAMHWVGLPSMNEIPSPGDARNWQLADWCRWCKDSGFVEVRRSATVALFAHQLVGDTVAITVPLRALDQRTTMNYMATIRREILSAGSLLDVQLRRNVQSLPDDEASAKKVLVSCLNDPADIMLDADCSNMARVPGATLYQQLTALSRSEKRGMAEILKAALPEPTTPEMIERTIFAAKNGHDIPRMSYDLVVEYRKSLEAEAELEKEAKRAARAFKTKSASPATRVAELLQGIQRQRKTDTDAVVAALSSALTLAQRAAENAGGAIPVPDLTDDDTKGKLEDLQNQVAQAQLDNTTLQAEVDKLKVELAITAVKPQGVEHRLAFARLILETIAVTDLTNLRENFLAIKTAATEEIAAATAELEAMKAAAGAR
jgi:hypothetical protein